VIRLAPNNAAQTVPLVCMGSSATYNAEAIAPGEIVTLFGNSLGPAPGIATSATPQTPFPRSAGGVQVTFDGRPAPLLWVQDAQINAVAPWELTPGQTTKVCVLYNETPTNCLRWPVVEVAPGVFTTDGVHAAAFNDDGTLNSATNPAKANSFVTIFATGMGPLSPPQPDGSLVAPPLPTNELPVSVLYVPDCLEPLFCTNQPLAVNYAGPAQFGVAGLTEINVQVPPVGSSSSYSNVGLMYVSLNTSTYARGFRVW